jgi:hypothetical protein
VNAVDLVITLVGAAAGLVTLTLRVLFVAGGCRLHGL